MEFLSNGEGYSIPNAIPVNTSPPPYSSPSLFGFHYAENSQFADGFPQLQQKTRNPADNELIKPEETEGLAISSDNAEVVQRRPVPIPMSTHAEATSGTTSEIRHPSVSLSVNGGGTVKVGKKRSRASSSTPTTVLNTDTVNFKAMVQRFTGIPETPFRFASTNPTFSEHVGKQEMQFLGKSLPYRVLLDPNINSVPHLNSVPDSYHPQQYNRIGPLPFLSVHDYINNNSPLNLFPEASQGKSSNTAPVDDVGLIDSASVFPSDRRSTYLI